METKSFALFVLIFSLFTMLPVTSLQAQNSSFIVVLDAGHGGKDPGNRGNGYFEKDIALNIVLAVGKELEKNKDIKVVYTRKTDVFLELHERAAIANRNEADLFVSIHCNAHSSAAHGTETFVLGLHKSKENFEIAKKENQVIFLEENYQETYEGFDPNSPESIIGLTLLQEDYLGQSIEVASYIQDNFTKQLNRNNRSVKQAGFLVLLQTYMPSVLIETGFLTNKNEGAYLNSKNGQADMASAISKAINDYYNSITATYSGISERPIATQDPLKMHKEDIYEDVVFKVQIAASKRKLDTKPQNFMGLSMISREQEGDLYRYYFGSTSDYNKIKNLQKEAKQKGYTTAFIVAFQNGKKANLADIIN